MPRTREERANYEDAPERPSADPAIAALRVLALAFAAPVAGQSQSAL